jgi:hypothetical protein
MSAGTRRNQRYNCASKWSRVIYRFFKKVQQFQYNYWCSPCRGKVATQEILLGITQLKDIVDLTTSNNPGILAMNNYNGTASPFAIAPF